MYPNLFFGFVTKTRDFRAFWISTAQLRYVTNWNHLKLSLKEVYFFPHICNFWPKRFKSLFWLRIASLKYFLTLESAYESWEIEFSKIWKKNFFQALVGLGLKNISTYNWKNPKNKKSCFANLTIKKLVFQLLTTKNEFFW